MYTDIFLPIHFMLEYEGLLVLERMMEPIIPSFYCLDSLLTL